ncbi:hypothetical protein HanIR_Chr17g0893761 [Helianthus annuus]|nr:hypothetical protein HanIR_Chr17g0893761 [Helianthus annuus]
MTKDEYNTPPTNRYSRLGTFKTTVFLTSLITYAYVSFSRFKVGILYLNNFSSPQSFTSSDKFSMTGQP